MVQSLGILVFLLVDGERDFQGGLGRLTQVTRQIESHSDVLLLNVHGPFLGYLSYVVNAIIPVLRKWSQEFKNSLNYLEGPRLAGSV